jgi:BirA family biotin operon repressor/biotin-[acetyl-CoA-carboxylase] ligase
MDKDQKLFELLSQGEFVSGEILAKSFGVTRSRVWSLVNSLEEKGVDISRVRGRGYRYRGGSSLLSVSKLESGLTDLPVYYFPTLTSTNDVARDYVKNSLGPLLVTTEYQTGGRGRRGRAWASCYAHNLMFTYAIPKFNSMKGLEGLSLVVGVTIASVVNQIYGVKAQVKWPNDLMLEGAKLAGILIEVQGDIGGEYSLLVGVGINVNETPAVEDRMVESLASVLGKPIDRSELLIELVNALQKNIEAFSQSGFSEFKDIWNGLDAFRGESVFVDQAGTKITGKALGVSDSGALLLEVGNDIREIHGGEVSLRLSDD